MPNKLVRIFTGEFAEDKGSDEIWHLIDPENGEGQVILCGGEHFRLDHSECVYEEKKVKRGGISCTGCLRKLKAYKAVKL